MKIATKFNVLRRFTTPKPTPKQNKGCGGCTDSPEFKRWEEQRNGKRNRNK